ncbi:MAG: hypothetical protein HYS44_02100 [Candidatus Niyogibacteria bacterium]|nr:hypothetical protein [Candidatus Niyogibacteria bacterium]
MAPVKEHYFDAFRNAFLENIQKRSRTAKGESHAGVSAAKRPLQKTGEELKAQVAANTNILIKRVWDAWWIQPVRDARAIRQMMEAWYDIVQCDLQESDPYEGERALLTKEANRLSASTGLPFRINPRYRVWDVSYAGWNPPPAELEIHMDIFYARLHELIRWGQKEESVWPFILAWADRMMDFVIHPWADGCGRMSTTTVMWLALILTDGGPVPEFGTREKHYFAMKNIAEHAAYFERCLARWK